MAKPKRHTRAELVAGAMAIFWHRGYYATSMDDLVRSTGVSRHGIYSEFGGKAELFIECLDAYVRIVVDPAFSRVERPTATLVEVAEYFEVQIAASEAGGLPRPGCLLANTMTELAPHDATILHCVNRHNERLRSGFLTALRNSSKAEASMTPSRLDELAFSLVVFTNGLWSISRVSSSAADLRRSVRSILQRVRMVLHET